MSTWVKPELLQEGLQAALLKTPRLTLRQFAHGDRKALAHAMAASQNNPWLWIRWSTQHPPSENDCKKFVSKLVSGYSDSENLDLSFAVIETATSELLGSVGMHRIDANTNTAELGYWIRDDRSREGFCTEAAARLVSVAFIPQDQGGFGIRRIRARCATENVPSIRVAEKLGLRLECRERAERPILNDPSKFLDSLGYANLNYEWDQKAGRALKQVTQNAQNAKRKTPSARAPGVNRKRLSPT